MAQAFAARVPGVLAALAVAAGARLLHVALPDRVGQVVGEVLIAVAIGLALGNLVRLPAGLESGLRFAFGTLLKTAIVLLGASLSLAEVGRVGGRVVFQIVALMALALALGHLLGRWLGVPPRVASLIGVGTAVCGNTAISAVAPVIRARDEEVSFAIATNTLFGTMAVLAYPVIGHLLGLSDGVFGVWAGTAVNDTSQVVAAGFAYSEAAGQMATTVKLVRNALMGLVILFMGWLYREPGATAEANAGASPWRRLVDSFPVFVLGFLALSALRTFGAFEPLSAALGVDVLAGLLVAAKLLVLVALAAVGLTTRFAELRKIGFQPLYVGLAVAAAVAVTSLALTLAWPPG
jgi:uncharacterized integral membrane protein (TIGR00698 family)